MQFTLTINCDGAAFTRVTNDEDNGTTDAAPEVSRLLRVIEDRVSRLSSSVQVGDEWPLVDNNGQVVGRARFEEV